MMFNIEIYRVFYYVENEIIVFLGFKGIYIVIYFFKIWGIIEEELESSVNIIDNNSVFYISMDNSMYKWIFWFEGLCIKLS